jgi:GTP pyrophosphokinase
MAKEKAAWQAHSPQFAFAFTLACEGHTDEVRKGSNIPYVGHLLGVASTVIEAGGTLDQACGALLHDLLEDTPTTREELEAKTSKDITDIVWGCTDTTYAKKQEYKAAAQKGNWTDQQKADHWWEVRKKPYIEKIAQKSPADLSLLVSLADKTYNAENTVADLRKCEPHLHYIVWSKFNVGYDYQSQWYQGLLKAFRKDGYSPGMQDLFQRFEKAVNEMFPQSNEK